MSEENKWTEDWAAFVRNVGDLLGRGMDNARATAHFTGIRVRWEGTVGEKRFDIERPGVQMDMPAVNIEFPNGKRAEVNYLFLTLREGELELWHSVEVGAAVRFETEISQGSGPFPGIEWSDLDDEGGVIMFLTDGAIPIDV